MGMPRIKSGQEPIPNDDRTMKRVVDRLAHEAYHLREDFAALKVIEATCVRSPFIVVTEAAYQSDVLVRPMRVLEWEERVGSFWLLYDRGLVKAEQDQINRLKSFSKRLLTIRNKTFFHIDGRELFDSQRVYRKANIKWRSDVESAIELISSIVNGLYSERFGPSDIQRTIADLEEIFTRNLLLSKDRESRSRNLSPATMN
jgi:hypothetical protein